MTLKRALGLVLGIGALAVITACQQGGGAIKIEKIEPPQGTTAGGEEVTILGDGFQPGKTQAEVRFGRKKSEVVTIASTGKIKVVTPVGDKGPIDVTLAFDDGRVFKLKDGFRYVEPAENSNARNAFFGGNKAGGANKIEVEKR
jgi:IPT/TIG domain